MRICSGIKLYVLWRPEVARPKNFVTYFCVFLEKRSFSNCRYCRITPKICQGKSAAFGSRCSRFHSGQPPKIVSFPLGDLQPHLIHSSLGPSKSLSERHLDQFSRFCTAYHRVSHYFTAGHYVFPKKLPLPFGGSGPDLIHMVGLPRAHPSHHPKRHLDRFSRFCMDSKCYAVQSIVNGE